MQGFPKRAWDICALCVSGLFLLASVRIGLRPGAGSGVGCGTSQIQFFARAFRRVEQNPRSGYGASLSVTYPKGSIYLPFKNPNTIPAIVLEPESLNGQYMDPLGYPTVCRFRNSSSRQEAGAESCVLIC